MSKESHGIPARDYTDTTRELYSCDLSSMPHGTPTGDVPCVQSELLARHMGYARTCNTDDHERYIDEYHDTYRDQDIAQDLITRASNISRDLHSRGNTHATRDSSTNDTSYYGTHSPRGQSQMATHFSDRRTIDDPPKVHKSRVCVVRECTRLKRCNL
jgi:hypothetical protein